MKHALKLNQYRVAVIYETLSIYMYNVYILEPLRISDCSEELMFDKIKDFNGELELIKGKHVGSL